MIPKLTKDELQVIVDSFNLPMCEGGYCIYSDECDVKSPWKACDELLKVIGVRELNTIERKHIASSLFVNEGITCYRCPIESKCRMSKIPICAEISRKVTGYTWNSDSLWIQESTINCDCCANALNATFQCVNCCDGTNFDPAFVGASKYIEEE